jgi:hypothetical protein
MVFAGFAQAAYEKIHNHATLLGWHNIVQVVP